MSPTDRDVMILEKIIGYCDEIAHAKARFGDSLDALKTDVEYKNSVAMDILQIGELTTHLSDDFKQKYSAQPWRDINGMRNIAAHHYGSLNVKILWNTINKRIPELREYCVECLKIISTKHTM